MSRFEALRDGTRLAIASFVIVASACGDNVVPAVEPSDLVVVAHQDDDLLFMQPDMYDLVSAHRPITVVYVTAGDGGSGLDYVAARKRAVMNAYATVSGSAGWSCEQTEIAAHTVETCSLANRPVALVFLDYPDGGVTGEAPQSLLRLWEGSIELATTISASPTSYTRPELIHTVAAIIDDTRPATIRTLDVSGTHGDDHSDHMIVGALTQLALAEAEHDAELVSYRGYNINYEPANLPEDVFQRASLFMRAYSACMGSCGVCGETPCATVDDPRFYNFLHRSYPIDMRDAPLAGVLSSPSGCLGVAGDDVKLGACTHAPDIRLGEIGLIHIDDQCLEVQHDGLLGLGACEPEPERYFQLDQEGHLWSGVAPDPEPGMLYDHSTCVYPEGGVLVAGVCGRRNDWRWQVIP